MNGAAEGPAQTQTAQAQTAQTQTAQTQTAQTQTAQAPGFFPPATGYLAHAASTHDLLAWAIQTHPDLLMPSAFNLNGVVLIDLAVRAGYRGEVLFVDTGYHFPETGQTRDRLAARYPELTFVTLNAGASPEDGRTPPDLYASDPDACCAARKVAPLQEYLRHKNPSALLNARSRDQAATRAEIPVIETGGARLKINPLAGWTRAELEAYAAAHELPLNPLYADGFLSVGCWTCTRAVRPGEDARAGRWAGHGKTECGLWAGERKL